MWTAILIFITTFLVKSADQTQSTCWDVLNHPNCKQLPDDDLCGPVTTKPLVLGGYDATLGQFPWMALLYFRKFPSREMHFGCGGSVISAKLVISAAHCCVKERFGRKLTMVRVGDHNLSSTEDCLSDIVCAPPPQTIRVDHCIVHEGYNPRTFQNDISIIVLKKAIEFNAFISPICLPISNQFYERNFENYTLEIAGWGMNKNHVTATSETLQALTVDVVPRPLCQEFFSGLRITGMHLCAGGEEGKDSCKGDSGGPLMGQFVVDIPRARYFLIGVISFGSSPCGISMPGVFVNIPRYIPWILDSMNI